MNIQQFWSDVLAQRADEIREYFHADAYVNWHCSNEHFTVEEFIRANCEYPGHWAGEVEQMEEVNGMVHEAIRQCAEEYLLNTKDLKNQLIDIRERLSSENMLRESYDPGIQLVDNYYYQIEGVRMRERLLIFASDYQQLDDIGKQFFLQKEKYKANCCILKKFDPMLHSKANPKQIYTLKRGIRSVFINGYEYKVLCHENCAPPSALPSEENMDRQLEEIKEKIDLAEKNWEMILGTETTELDNHLFLSETEKRTLKRIFEAQKNNILRYRNEWKYLIDTAQKELICKRLDPMLNSINTQKTADI